MSAEEHGLAAAIGAAVAGAASAVAALRGRKRRRIETPSEPLPSPSAMSVRIGLLVARVEHLENEVAMLKHTLDTKIDRLAESVDELGKASAVTTALLPQVQVQLAELRAELRDHRAPRGR